MNRTRVVSFTRQHYATLYYRGYVIRILRFFGQDYMYVEIKTKFLCHA